MARSRFRASGLCLALALVLARFALPLPAYADDVPGDVIVAKASDDAQLVWDATPDVAQLVKDKLSDAAAASFLAHDALRVIAANLDDVSDAKTITVNVHYNKTGEVNPQYNGATFLGVERYALVTIDAKDAKTNRDGWKTLDAKKPVPSWVHVKVTGQLPPR